MGLRKALGAPPSCVIRAKMDVRESLKIPKAARGSTVHLLDAGHGLDAQIPRTCGGVYADTPGPRRTSARVRTCPCRRHHHFRRLKPALLTDRGRASATCAPVAARRRASHPTPGPPPQRAPGPCTRTRTGTRTPSGAPDPDLRDNAFASRKANNKMPARACLTFG